MAAPDGPTEVYLGDGVYAKDEPDSPMVVYTSDGLRITNRIYFEPAVLHALIDFAVMRGVIVRGKVPDGS